MEDSFRFSLDEIEETRAGRRWLEIFRVAPMSVGVYRLEAGAADPQGPHAEDELYHVVAGRAELEVGTERHAAIPGSLLYVRAGVPHRFVEIAATLITLVVFAPAESR
jgi:mannose-6-phosphate isomerase-like protein (cupin superfamily)